MTVGIVILDMDGTLLSKRSIDVLCEGLGLMERLAQVDRLSPSLPAYRVSEIIASFFTGLQRSRLEELFDSIPLNRNAHDFVSYLKTNEFFVAIATDSYEFLADRLARKIGADSVYGNIVEMQEDVVTGRLLTDHHCLKIQGCREYSTCKLWFMRKLKKTIGGLTVAIGDSESDLCMIKEADIGVAYCPKSESIVKVAKIVASSFLEIQHILEKLTASRWRTETIDDWHRS
jgi:HAD superfamily phosphoserine phosphatase-like hydrolase